MAIKPIVYLPDPILRVKSAEVENINDNVRSFVDDMFETMYDAPGIGLAAIQLGQPLRVLTMDVTWTSRSDEKDEQITAVEKPKPEKSTPIAMINPKLIWTSEERAVFEEGCLSIPDYMADVERPAECRVEYIDTQGKQQHLHATGLTATCVMHELDHLDGVLFIDYLSRMRREMVIRKFTKIAKQNQTQMIG